MKRMQLLDLHDRSRIIKHAQNAPEVKDMAPIGESFQPVSNVNWVPRDLLSANDYNPNIVAPPELKLLKISLLSDGWTQPIVVRPVQNEEKYEIVDGFHRWMVSFDEDVSALTNGYVPIVVLRNVSQEHQIMSTVRHNRARGSHHVLRMADIVQSLSSKGMSNEEIGDLLQMEQEEVIRFLDRGNMAKRGSKADFNQGWVPE